MGNTSVPILSRPTLSSPTAALGPPVDSGTNLLFVDRLLRATRARTESTGGGSRANIMTTRPLQLRLDGAASRNSATSRSCRASCYVGAQAPPARRLVPSASRTARSSSLPPEAACAAIPFCASFTGQKAGRIGAAAKMLDEDMEGVTALNRNTSGPTFRSTLDHLCNFFPAAKRSCPYSQGKP